jgi:hypothetical protein
VFTVKCLWFERLLDSSKLYRSYIAGLTQHLQCEADLPSSLRFGRVEVSCEGWNGPGDPYVMKGLILIHVGCLQSLTIITQDPVPLNTTSFNSPILSTTTLTQAGLTSTPDHGSAVSLEHTRLPTLTYSLLNQTLIIPVSSSCLYGS